MPTIGLAERILEGGAKLVGTTTGAVYQSRTRIATLGDPSMTPSEAPAVGERGAVLQLEDVVRATPDGSPFASSVGSALVATLTSRAGTTIGHVVFTHPARGAFDAGAVRALGPFVDLASMAFEYASRAHLVNEATQEGVWFWDVSTNTVEWNDPLIASMGLTRAEWGGTFEDWFSRVHPDDQPRMGAALEAHLARRGPYSIDVFRLKHASGEYRYMTTAGQAEWDESGRPLRMAGSVRDVTAQVTAEQTLRASEHRYAQILDSVEDMVFSKAPGGAVRYVNRATCRFYEKTADELAGEGLPEGGETAEARDIENAVFTTGVPVVRENDPRTSAAGETRWFHTVTSPVFEADGTVRELVGVARDVTELRREHARQRFLAEASETLGSSLDYEATLSNIARAIVPTLADWASVDMLDPDGAIRRVAVAHVDPAKVALAHELHRRLPPNPNDPVGLPQVLRSGQPDFIAEIPEQLLIDLLKDKEPDIVKIALDLGLRSSIVVPLKTHDRVVGAISLVTAESKRLYTRADLAFAEELARRASIAVENARLYAEVRHLNASLEQRVEARTAALVEANNELESFSYSVSHDLRAPIRHISGFADLLKTANASRLDDKGLHYLDTIRSAATRMGTLIDGLLAFSRYGRAELAKAAVPLKSLVATVIRDLEMETRGRTVEFAVGDLPTVPGDATMLRLVFTNLIQNAVKYTRPRAEAHIEIGARVEGREHVVWVKDDGVGFDQTYAHKLFGVFQRLHENTEFEGTGIGLATTRRIVHRHGGRVWAEGTKGAGATFYVTLPVEESAP